MYRNEKIFAKTYQSVYSSPYPGRRIGCIYQLELPHLRLGETERGGMLRAGFGEWLAQTNHVSSLGLLARLQQLCESIRHILHLGTSKLLP
jgi:hypothetical protein